MRSIFYLPALFMVMAATAAEVRDNAGSRSVYDAAGKTLEKLNHTGYTVWKSDPVAVEAGKAYCGKLTLDVLERVPGAMASVRLVMLNGDKLMISAQAEPQGTHQQLFSLGKQETLRRSPVAHGAQFMRLEVVLLGNPAKVKIIHPEIYDAPPLTSVPGTYSAKKPYPDREKELEIMRRLPDSTAKVVKRNGRCVVLVDGRETIFKSYKGSIDYGELHSAGINLIQSFNAGITLFWDKMSWDMATMGKDGKFDFSRLEKELLFMHHYAPGAKVLLNVNVDVGEDFFRQYPGSIFRNEAGEAGVRRFTGFAGFGVPGPEPAKNRHYAVSYASENYQQYVCRGLKALAEFLKNSPVGKIVVGFGFNGGHDDQLFQWEYSSMRGQGDYSPDALRAYRKYLKTKYASDTALQQAWLDDSVTLDTAPLFSEKEWQSRTFWSAGKLGVDRKICDGRAFMSDSIAAMNRRFARTLKEHIGKDVIVGTYYSSPLWGQAGRSHLHRLAENNGIDAVFQVSGYSYMRRLGGPGASANFAIAAAHSAGMIYLQEMDHRTHRSQLTAGWSKDSLGYPDTPAQFQDQIFRDAGAVLACGGDGFYYFDMFDSWYNDPAVLAAIRITVNAADFSTRYRHEVPRSEAAIFLDEKERLVNMHTSSGPQVWSSARLSGITPDIYLLEDLTREMPDYKLWIIPDALTLSAEQLQALKEKAFKKGNCILITGSPGALRSSVPGTAAETLAQLGIKVRDRLSPVTDFTEFTAAVADKLLQNCIGRAGLMDLFYHPGGAANHTRLRFSTVLDDPQFTILGRWNASKEPAIGVKRGKDGTFIYSAHPAGVTPQLIHNAAIEAGILPHSAAGNAVAVGNGVISVHRLAQEVVVEFARDMEFIDPANGKIIGRGKKMPVDCPVRGSRLINYRPAE